jgi:hypothetical protein
MPRLRVQAMSKEQIQFLMYIAASNGDMEHYTRLEKRLEKLK